MDDDTLDRICATAARLRAEDVTWDELETLLSPFPGWMGLLHEMRYPRLSVDNRISWGPVRVEFTELSPEARTRLHEFFEPFGILADITRTPTECAEALVNAGYDAEAFCKEHSRDGIVEIARRSAETLDAIRMQKGLLRAASSSSLAPQELLRLPGAEQPGSKSIQTSMLQRLLSMFIRRR